MTKEPFPKDLCFSCGDPIQVACPQDLEHDLEPRLCQQCLYLGSGKAGLGGGYSKNPEPRRGRRKVRSTKTW